MEDISVEGKKVVVYDSLEPHARQNLCFDRNVAKGEWYRYSSPYLYEECLKKGIQLITPDIYFALSKKPKAICLRVRDDVDMSVSFALRRAGVRLALMKSAENPLYACRFYWNLKRLTSYFDYAEVVSGVKDWVSPNCRWRRQYNQHVYRPLIREVRSDFHKKKFLVLMQRNARVHWARRLLPGPVYTVLELLF